MESSRVTDAFALMAPFAANSSQRALAIYLMKYRQFLLQTAAIPHTERCHFNYTHGGLALVCHPPTIPREYIKCAHPIGRAFHVLA